MTTPNTISKISTRRAQRNPKLQARISHLAFTLAPLVQMGTCAIHPAFPPTLLHYHLLTELQLEELAHFYHQRTPCALTNAYPLPMKWRASLTVEEKRRKWGRFIGLKGCETPLVVKTEEEIWEEARKARMADDNDLWRRKGEWY